MKRTERRDVQMFDLIKVVSRTGQMVFMWMRNGATLAGHQGFLDVQQAADWFEQNYAMAYKGPERRNSLDRRSGNERRSRVSPFERRQRPQGRRWLDELERF